jgi:hypothetical protein
MPIATALFESQSEAKGRTRDRQRLIDYSAHMLEAIERIYRYTEDIDELAFLQNELIQMSSSATWKFSAKPPAAFKNIIRSSRHGIPNCP